jgi:hypothetical protein
VQAGFKVLRAETQDGFTGVGEAIENVSSMWKRPNRATDRRLTWVEAAVSANGEQLANHAKRLRRLEGRRPV